MKGVESMDASMEKTLKNFESHGIKARYFETGEQARQAIVQAVQGKKVAFGGSVTLQQLGFMRPWSRTIRFSGTGSLPQKSGGSGKRNVRSFSLRPMPSAAPGRSSTSTAPAIG